MLKILRKNKYLLLRRITQLGLIMLFIAGNCSLATFKNVQNMSSVYIFGGDISDFVGDSQSILAKNPNPTISIVQGNLSYAKWFDGAFSLSDPLSVAQIALAGGGLSLDMLLGAFIVLVIYGVFFGRAYCAYICPINPITDAANYLRDKIGLNKTSQFRFSRNTRFVVLILALVLSVIFGVGAFEMISPISMLHRGLVFGMGFGILAVFAVFLFDLFVLKHGFCGHICPLGATYSLIGKFALLRIVHKVENCTHCMQCVRICPEPDVLKPVGKQSGALKAMACMRCGRCVEVCDDNALKFGILNFSQRR